MKATLAPHKSERTSAASPEFRLGLGAEARADGVFFRVWAPDRKAVEVALEDGRAHALARGDDGYFSGVVAEAGTGTLYRYRLDGEGPFPDPCSRFQPQGPHGPSCVVDPAAFAWTDAEWNGLRIHGQVFYELHVGTFTPEGTFDAAASQLDRLKDLGVTAVELMPVHEFPGRFNWGYDGVGLYAPSRVYGGPDALKRFIDGAHARGLGVILDVVYNHLGPDGNYLNCFSKSYFTDRYATDWGAAVNFDGPGSAGTREFFVRNACYWVHEYHADGLRLDATQNIYDAGRVHVVAEISRRARQAAGARDIVLVAENEPQNMTYVAPLEKGGYGFDALWADDFHHSARVALTGRREAYYADYAGSAQEFVSLVKRGCLYQGQYYSWQKQNRGRPVTVEPASAFVFFLENHDQVGNSLKGLHVAGLAAPGRLRAMTALWLLAPETPLLFMGQEFGAPAPFLFFADHPGKLGRDVLKGRSGFLAQFPSAATPASQSEIPDPADASTFLRCVLDPAACDAAAPAYALHRDLLALRREDPVLRLQDRKAVDGAVLAPEAFVIRFENARGARLLALNLGAETEIGPVSEPLLAPPAGGAWRLLWSSDDTRYGGLGVIDASRGDGWRLPGQSALLYEGFPARPGGPS